MKKGFTLIELLAVIVILAIIALIATPIVLNLINDSRKESMRLSAENYLDAVEVSLANAYMKDNSILLSDTYEISENGKKLISTNKKEISIEFDGTPIKEGSLKVEKGNVEYIDVARIDEWYAIIVSDRVKLVDDILVDGSSFRNSMFYDAESIEFLPNGKIPEEYTKSEFKNLINSKDIQRKNVSLNGYVKAIYDEANKKIFIYSDGDIVFNSDSSYMFFKLTSIEKIIFNDVITSQVKNMSLMFQECTSLKNLDLSNFDTSNVTLMSYMFYKCEKLENLNLNNIDTKKVTRMQSMFSYCKVLETIDLSNFDTRNVIDLSYMFAWSEKLKELNLKSFDTGKVKFINHIFYSASSLEKIKVSSNWSIENAKNKSNMFDGCIANQVTVVN